MKPSNEQILRDALQTVLDEGLPVGPGYVKIEADARATLAATAPESAPADAVACIIVDKNGGANTGSLPPIPLPMWVNSLPPIGTKLYTHPAPSQSADQVRDALTAVDDQLVAILNKADGYWYNKLKAARDDLVRVWLPMGKPAPSIAASESAEASAAYQELLYAVASKHPGESRHQTALRYIRERESLATSSAAKGEAA